MENFLLYIGKSALAAGAFYLVYLALFQNQKQFTFNRIYLPVSLALSFAIPLITFTTVNYVEPVPVESNPLPVFTESFEPVIAQQSRPQFIWEWYHYLFAIYAAGTLLFLFRLLLGHAKAWSIIRKSRVQELFNSLVNISKKDIHPFSFFSKILLSEKTLSYPHLKIIVEHEKIHVKEKHTLDILFTEILFLLQWFNPFAWLLKDAVKNNLEYKTDHEIAKTTDAQTYQLAMLALADKQGVAPFLTALNGSQLKSRIIMMKKKTRNKFGWLKQLAVLPLLAVLVMGLAEREVKTEFIQPEIQNEFTTSEKIIKGKVINENEESIEGAVIQIEGTDIKTTSNSDGTLELETEKMPVTVIISKENYDTCYITLNEVYKFKIILTQDGITRRFKCTSNPDPKLITPNSSEINDIDEFYNTIINEPLVYSQVEEMPEFPGGVLALQKFINNSMNYPKSAKNKAIEGTVYVTFIIDKEGNVTNAKVAGEEESLYEEALRIINSFPRWKPGKHEGKPVNVRVTIPVKFDLKELENNKQNTLQGNSNLAEVNQNEFDFSKLKIVVDGKEIPTDSPELKNLNLGGLFDIATSSKMLSKRNETISNIINAIKIDKEKIELKQFNGRYPEVSTLYIRTKDYVPGTNSEFERQTDNPEFIKEKIHSKKNSTEVNSQKEIQGKVTNEKGEPIEGASVVVEGREFGVATNSKGNYQIEIEPTDEVLIFGYLYHDKQKVKIDGKDKIDVQIRTDRNPPTSGSFLTSSFKMRNSRGDMVKPVYLVNEEEVDIEEVDRQFIYSFQRLPDSTATKLYGQKGKNGVIILKLKNPEDLNTISGKITNEKGEPVEGATIVEYDEPGSAVNSTLSDKNGNFVYVIKRDKAVIKVVHFLYKTKELNINEKKVIDVQLEKKAEGSRLNTDKEDDIVIGNINWINNEIYSSIELTNALGVKEGDEYSKEIIEGRVYGEVSSLYMDNGYLFFNITITEKEKNDNTVDLEFTVFEGTRWKIGKIDIIGNKADSAKKYINKIEIKSGDLFSKSKLIASVRSLNEMINLDAEIVDVEVSPELVYHNNIFNNVNLVFRIIEK